MAPKRQKTQIPAPNRTAEEWRYALVNRSVSNKTQSTYQRAIARMKEYCKTHEVVVGSPGSKSEYDAFTVYASEAVVNAGRSDATMQVLRSALIKEAVASGVTDSRNPYRDSQCTQFMKGLKQERDTSNPAGVKEAIHVDFMTAMVEEASEDELLWAVAFYIAFHCALRHNHLQLTLCRDLKLPDEKRSAVMIYCYAFKGDNGGYTRSQWAAILKPHERVVAYLKKRLQQSKPEEPVFGSWQQHEANQKLREMLTGVGHEATVGEVVMHALRHSGAVHMRSQGMTLADLRVACRWAPGSRMPRRYTALPPPGLESVEITNAAKHRDQFFFRETSEDVQERTATKKKVGKQKHQCSEDDDDPLDEVLAGLQHKKARRERAEWEGRWNDLFAGSWCFVTWSDEKGQSRVFVGQVLVDGLTESPALEEGAREEGTREVQCVLDLTHHGLNNWLMDELSFDADEDTDPVCALVYGTALPLPSRYKATVTEVYEADEEAVETITRRVEEVRGLPPMAAPMPLGVRKRE